MKNRYYRLTEKYILIVFCWGSTAAVSFAQPVGSRSAGRPTDSLADRQDRTITDTTVRDTSGVGVDSLPFPIYDRRSAPFVHPQPYSIDLQPPVRDSLYYDPKTGTYRLEEKTGNRYYRNPATYSRQQFLQLRGRQQEQDYWISRRNTFTDLNRSKEGPALYYGPQLFNRLFGGTEADINPQGNLGITLGYEGQNFKNLILPERARKTGGFDFNMDINMNIQGQIGKKLQLTSTYNTESVFDFDKQIKLEYTGDRNSIIQKIEAGNVSFPLRSQLISGVQSLFGIKTRLKFGRLTVTSVFSTQRSQKQNIIVQGGAQTNPIDIQADQYEANQHFFLGQYFRDHYNEAMSTLPVIRSQVHILRLQVWVTNKQGATTNARDVVGLMDLGESQPYNDNIHSLSSSPLLQNAANDEYRQVTAGGGMRNPGTVVSRLQGMGLLPVQDFEKTYARKLDSTEYTFNEKLGFVSLNRPLQPDEVLGVAFQYTYNGQVYQVGEFANNVPPDGKIAQPQILFLKLLKATSARPSLPIWDLMMKNIYSLGNSQINREGFRLDIFYQDPGGGEKRYLPDAQGAYEGRPLLSILQLDRLNSQNDPQPDGVFDFVSDYTIDPNRGTIIFPVLEPFGRALDVAFGGDSALAVRYKYQMLYDSTLTIAQQFPQYNRFVMRGSYKSNSSSDIYLGGFNIPRGSVTITAGGQQLIENVDYTINYSMGRVKIINDAILNSGLPINVRFENNALFGQQTRNYFGTRLDYYVNDHLTLGASVIRMTEKPYFNVVNYGDDPIANTIGGLDFNYRSELPGLTRWLDKLPNYSTEAMSSITATGEVARLFPGHSNLIGKGSQGTIYLDDFEGASNAFDLRYPYNSWSLASTPQGAVDENGNKLFPEAELGDSLAYGMQRALLAWYSIEPELVSGGQGMPSYFLSDKSQYLGHYTRLIKQQDVFPKRSVDYGQSYLNTLDLAYYPKERGPYNFVTDGARVNDDGELTQPEDSWGGIMRPLDNTDFESSNVQYIEFWVMDPFIDRPAEAGGYLYINLGNLSEDILRDGKMAFENGLPGSADQLNKTDTSVWGRVPRFQEQITNAFDNDPSARAHQDVGFDGMDNEQEAVFHKAYLQGLLQAFGPASAIYQQAAADPSNDDYHFYRGKDFDEAKLGVLARYKRFNGSDGNSPVSSSSTTYSSAATNRPETEDLNNDNTLNETEEYFQYRIAMKPDMEVGKDFIVDKIVVPPNEKNGPLTPETWYQFRIPIQQYDKKVGNIPDFKSIRFMRMFLTGFQDSVVMRFARLGLVRNQWRTYLYHLDTSGVYVPVDPNKDANLVVSSVNLEENATRTPVPYVIPPGVQRQSQLSQNNVNLYLNEQSLSLKVTDLSDGKARAVFKDMGVDLRKFSRLQLFIHAEAIEGAPLQNGEVQAVIRIGSDFVNNYYEYRIPLKLTDPTGSMNANTIWPDANQLDVNLSIFPQLKQERNQTGASVSRPYTIQDKKGNYVTVVGNPSLGDVREALLGVLNPTAEQGDVADDGFPKSAIVWFDELRVSNMDESGGYAALGRVDLNLADLGAISLAGSMHTAGFGNVDQQLLERFKDDYYQYDVSANLELGKLLPDQWRLSIPIYAGYSETISNPEYDPYDLDIKLKDKLAMARNAHERDSILRAAQDFTSITSLNLTNVRVLPDPDKTTNRFWALSNFNLSYSFSRIYAHNPLIDNDILTRNRLGVGYQFSGKSKYVAPLRNVIGASPYLALLRDFNFNLIPSVVSVRAEIDRQFGQTNVRNIGGGPFQIPATFDKYFTFDRYYTLHWDLSKSLSLDFQAVNNSRVDEPYGRINTPQKKDTVWQNLITFGRPTLFHQNASASYTLPLQKFPLLDWMNIRLDYSTDYSWMTASLLAPYLGNTIENSSQKQLNANLDFNRLYNKWSLLRRINNPVMRGRRDSSAAGKQNKEASEVSTGLRILLTPLLLIKRVAFKYSENARTFLPGYLNHVGFMGQDWTSLKPGLKFAFGWQPDLLWLDKIGDQGWLTHDSTLNVQYRQQFMQQLDLQASLEPVSGLRIDLRMYKTFSKNHSELFKDPSGRGQFQHLNPYDAGGFEVSYFSLKTLFDKIDAESGISNTYRQFENNRKIISDRLGALNPYTNGQKDPENPDYTLGYGRYAEDVLIPAFLSAYSGKDPKDIALLTGKSRDIRDNPFKSIKPFPNWTIKYNGLSRLPFFRQFVTNLTISHGYSSVLSMNSFSSAMFYADPLGLGYPGFVDSTSGNYVPYFLVPNITIAEQLNPLIGIDATFTNNLSVSFSYSKSRTLSLSLIDYQLTEMRSSQITLGAGFRIRNFPLPFNIGQESKLRNDLNFRLDMSYRDDKTVNNRIDADLLIPTSGRKVITISPSVDYVVNDRLNLHFFYNKRATIPFISTSYPLSNTEAGVTFRFVLQ